MSEELKCPYCNETSMVFIHNNLGILQLQPVTKERQLLLDVQCKICGREHSVAYNLTAVSIVTDEALHPV